MQVIYIYIYIYIYTQPGTKATVGPLSRTESACSDISFAYEDSAGCRSPRYRGKACCLNTEEIQAGQAKSPCAVT